MKIYIRLIAFVLVISIVFSFSCGGESDKIEFYNGFSVNYLDVGEGDCIFIRFPDGKNLLIDTGDDVNGNKSKIEEVFDTYRVEVLDYVILTHTDSDHIGNANYLLSGYATGKVYIPYVLDKEKYPEFNEVFGTIVNKEITYIYSKMFEEIKGDGYRLVMLSPSPAEFSDSSYNDFNMAEVPTTSQINNISPIIYLEYKGVRFLFTGDAEKEQEKFVIDNYKSNLYYYFGVNLDGIDFLKVGHHGAEDSSSEYFLSTLKPRYSVISVGGNNFYGHPSSSVLYRITSANSDGQILRTDVLGNISVFVDTQGNVNIK